MSILYDKVSFPNQSSIRASLARIEDYPFHMHENVLEIIFLLEGTLELTVVNNVLQMNADDIYICSSNELHRIRAAQAQDNLVMILHLNLASFLRDVPEITSYQFANSAIGKNRSGVRILGSYLKNQAEKIFHSFDPKNQHEIGLQILHILIAEFQCYYLGRYFPEFNKAFRDNEVQLNRIRRTCDYIYANLDQPLLIEEVAAREHISPNHLTHIMKVGTGVNFRTFLNMGRSERSARYLLENKKSLQAIAYECGFSKYRYFAACFEKCFRMTPQQYREQYSSQTVATKASRYTLLTGKELTRYLEQFAARSSEVTLDAAATAAQALTLPVCISLGGSFYDHLTDFPLLQQAVQYTRCSSIAVDTTLLRRYKNNQRAMFRLFIDLGSTGLPLHIQLDSTVSSPGLHGLLSLLHRLWGEYAPSRAAFSVTARSTAELSRARNLRKVVISGGFSCSLCEQSPVAGHNPLFGSGYMPAFLLHQFVQHRFSVPLQIPLLPETGKAAGEKLSILSAPGLYSPVANLISLLGKMGPELLALSDGCMAARSADRRVTQLLLYHYDRNYDSLFLDAAAAQENTSLLSLVAQRNDSRSCIRLHLACPDGAYALRQYTLSREDVHSRYKKEPKELSEQLPPETLELLNQSLAPETAVKLLMLDGGYHAELELGLFEVQLLIFERL